MQNEATIATMTDVHIIRNALGDNAMDEDNKPDHANSCHKRSRPTVRFGVLGHYLERCVTYNLHGKNSSYLLVTMMTRLRGLAICL